MRSLPVCLKFLGDPSEGYCLHLLKAWTSVAVSRSPGIPPRPHQIRRSAELRDQLRSSYRPLTACREGHRAAFVRHTTLVSETERRAVVWRGPSDGVARLATAPYSEAGLSLLICVERMGYLTEGTRLPEPDPSWARLVRSGSVPNGLDDGVCLGGSAAVMRWSPALIWMAAQAS